jgi:hypothetical protein|tara:strand:- start:1190 stop:1324 length:135 start_codon:yes stop_codon:yes gene_type:complete
VRINVSKQISDGFFFIKKLRFPLSFQFIMYQKERGKAREKEQGK